VRTRKHGWRARLSALTQAEAHAVRELVQGKGHSWSFDTDFYSDLKGLGPSSSTGASLDTGTKQYGAASLALTFPTGQITFPVGATAWTVAAWRRTTTFRHWVIRSDNTRWLDGVSDAVSSTAWLVVTSSTLQIVTAGFAGTWIDDLVFFPFLVPTTWPAELYAEAAARAWTPLPRLRLAGDVTAQLSGAAATVEGTALDAPTLMGAPSGTFLTTLEEVSFELTEV
jgi:hypothetical protein